MTQTTQGAGDDTLGILRAALEQVRRSYPDVTLQQLLTLLNVAANEGVCVTDLARDMDASISAVSRNVRRLTCPSYPGSLGASAGLLDLLRGERDGKFRHVVVSERGRAFLVGLRDALAPITTLRSQVGTSNERTQIQ